MTYTHKIECDLRVRPKQFFNYVNEKRNSKGLPSSIRFNDKEASNEQDIANLFAEFFRGVYKPASTGEPHMNAQSNTIQIPQCHLSESLISTTLSNLNDSMDMGPDDLPSLFLKRCAAFIAFSLQKFGKFQMFDPCLKRGREMTSPITGALKNCHSYQRNLKH